MRLCPWPWPWPRAFLSLASRVSVLGKAVLGLGLRFFLCPWPWPRALCPRLHLCLQLHDEAKIVQNKSYETPYDYAQCRAWAAHSQKFAIAGAVWGVWGRSLQPPKATGGLGAKPLAAGGTGVWRRNPQRLKILHFFSKIT